jgi:hypothetical protein
MAVNTRDWLRSEIEDELRDLAPAEHAQVPRFEAAFDAAMSDLGLTDRSIALLCEVAPAVEFNRDEMPALLASDPGIPGRRAALGLSTNDAAALVGVSPAGYEAIERAPLRWLNVHDLSKVSGFLSRLRIQPAVFLRWLASLRPAESGYAWGYTPGAVLDQPVAASASDQTQFINWGQELLNREGPFEDPTT